MAIVSKAKLTEIPGRLEVSPGSRGPEVIFAFGETLQLGLPAACGSGVSPTVGSCPLPCGVSGRRRVSGCTPQLHQPGRASGVGAGSSALSAEVPERALCEQGSKSTQPPHPMASPSRKHTGEKPFSVPNVGSVTSGRRTSWSMKPGTA